MVFRVGVAGLATAVGGLSEEISRLYCRSLYHPSHSEAESSLFQPTGESKKNRPPACTYLKVLLDLNYLYVLFPFVRSF